MKSFLQKVHERTRGIKGLELLVLYGSLVRGELTARSDIDFFALFHDERSLKQREKKLSSILDEACEEEYGRVASLYATSHEAEVDRSFLYNVFREGVAVSPLIETMVWDLFSLKPYVIFAYSLKNKPRPQKVKIDRILYGYRQRKGGKVYSYNGLVKGLGCIRFGNNLLVPLEKSEELKKFFDANDIRFKQRAIFLPATSTSDR